MKKNTIIVSIIAIAILVTGIFGCIRIHQLNEEVELLAKKNETLADDLTSVKETYNDTVEALAESTRYRIKLINENKDLKAKVDALEAGRLIYRKQLTDILDASGVNRNWYPEYSDDEYVKEVAFNNMSNDYFGNK